MRNLPRHEVRMLLNQIARGDDTAAARLYAAYQSLVYGYVRAQVWDDPHAVEEIVSDTLLVAFRKADAYTGVSEFSTWLCGIARNKVADWRRHTGRRGEVIVDDPDAIDAAVAPGWGVLELIEERERGAALVECMDRLPDSQREALYWSAVEECGLEEVAARTGVPEGTVKSRLFHARRRVRECLERAFGGGFGGERNG